MSSGLIVMKMQPIHLQFACVLGLLVASLVLMIVGAASPWYRLPLKKPPGATLHEYLTYLDAPDLSCSYSEGESCVGNNIRAMFALILAVVIVAHLLTGLQLLFLALYAFPRYSTLRWRERLWWPMIIICVIAALTTTASWTLLYMHPSSLAADFDKECNATVTAYFCNFSGHTFGPDFGWALFMVASLVMFAIVLVVPFFNFPRHIEQPSS